MKKLKNVGFIIGTVLLLAACLCAVIILLVPNSSAKYAASSTATGTVSITYSNEIKCTGGTADCDSLAVCEICGNEYGSYHHSGTETWEYDEEYHWQIWSCCRTEISEKAAHSYTEGLCACGRQSHYHIYELVEETAAGCTTTGTAAHYVCTNGCDLLFDAETKAEITAASLVIEAKGHSYGSAVTAPTCTAAGYTTYKCSGCGDTYTGNEVEALGHDYSSSVTAPTCTAAGYTTYTCTRCKDSYTGNNIAALGHNYSSTVTAPTCTEKGYTTHTCTQCNDNYVDTYVDANGHTATNGGTEAVHTKCSVCKAVISSDHSYSSKVTTAATCGATGIKTYSCTCGYSYTESIAATGNHSYPSTYQKDSSGHWKECSVCGNTTASTSHGYSDACDTTCDTCGYTRTAPHNYNNGYITTEAGCTTTGVKTYTCKSCSTLKTETVDATGHAPIYNNASGQVFCANSCGASTATPVTFMNRDTLLGGTLTGAGNISNMGNYVRFWNIGASSVAGSAIVNYVIGSESGRYVVLKYRVVGNNDLGANDILITYYNTATNASHTFAAASATMVKGQWSYAIFDMKTTTLPKSTIGFAFDNNNYAADGDMIDIECVAMFNDPSVANTWGGYLNAPDAAIDQVSDITNNFGYGLANNGVWTDEATFNGTSKTLGSIGMSAIDNGYTVNLDSELKSFSLRGHINYIDTANNLCLKVNKIGYSIDSLDTGSIVWCQNQPEDQGDLLTAFGVSANAIRFNINASFDTPIIESGQDCLIRIMYELDNGMIVTMVKYNIKIS
ncbi:MAG: hypothetical protein IJW65_00775 [Clostridia bacterium]|nr:hypothetical protein [Clostridia bacterium]